MESSTSLFRCTEHNKKRLADRTREWNKPIKTCYSCRNKTNKGAFCVYCVLRALLGKKHAYTYGVLPPSQFPLFSFTHSFLNMSAVSWIPTAVPDEIMLAPWKERTRAAEGVLKSLITAHIASETQATDRVTEARAKTVIEEFFHKFGPSSGGGKAEVADVVTLPFLADPPERSFLPPATYCAIKARYLHWNITGVVTTASRGVVIYGFSYVPAPDGEAAVFSYLLLDEWTQKIAETTSAAALPELLHSVPHISMPTELCSYINSLQPITAADATHVLLSWTRSGWVKLYSWEDIFSGEVVSPVVLVSGMDVPAVRGRFRAYEAAMLSRGEAAKRVVAAAMEASNRVVMQVVTQLQTEGLLENVTETLTMELEKQVFDDYDTFARNASITNRDDMHTPEDVAVLRCPKPDVAQYIPSGLFEPQCVAFAYPMVVLTAFGDPAVHIYELGVEGGEGGESAHRKVGVFMATEAFDPVERVVMQVSDGLPVGVLVGSKCGRIWRVNLKTEKVELIYEHASEAPITYLVSIGSRVQPGQWDIVAVTISTLIYIRASVRHGVHLLRVPPLSGVVYPDPDIVVTQCVTDGLIEIYSFFEARNALIKVQEMREWMVDCGPEALKEYSVEQAAALQMNATVHIMGPSALGGEFGVVFGGSSGAVFLLAFKLPAALNGRVLTGISGGVHGNYLNPALEVPTPTPQKNHEEGEEVNEEAALAKAIEELVV